MNQQKRGNIRNAFSSNAVILSCHQPILKPTFSWRDTYLLRQKVTVNTARERAFRTSPQHFPLTVPVGTSSCPLILVRYPHRTYLFGILSAHDFVFALVHALLRLRGGLGPHHGITPAAATGPSHLLRVLPRRRRFLMLLMMVIVMMMMVVMVMVMVVVSSAARGRGISIGHVEGVLHVGDSARFYAARGEISHVQGVFQAERGRDFFANELVAPSESVRRSIRCRLRRVERGRRGGGAKGGKGVGTAPTLLRHSNKGVVEVSA